jgi:cytochrome c oxidase subunit III
MKIRKVDDVGSLPDEVYGPANITWWGALGSEVIEGTVMLLAVFAYFYLAHDSSAWPPLHTPLPSLGVPTLNMVLMLLSVIPAVYAARAAYREERWKSAAALAVHGLIGVAIVVLRYYECRALNVRWDTNAYASISWALLFTHGYMTLFDVINTLGLVLLFVRLEPAKKHYVEVDENSFFWYFVVATWIPLYLIVFFGPRWM